MRMTTRTRWLLLGALLGGIVLFGLWRSVCIRAWIRYGVALRHCPDGTPRQVVSVQASSLRRGGAGSVAVSAQARYAVAGEVVESEPLTSFDTTLALVDAAGKETALSPDGGWETAGPTHSANLALPTVPDGDYRLRAVVTSKIGKDTVDVPLALYAPARIHVLTDRPLYEPGHTVKFRAVALRARDLTPLDGRPGVWIVKDPSGEVLLEEKAPAGPWGVVAGSFPLDAGAATGTWHIAWASGGASDEVAIQVEPFTLPRFRVEVTAPKPFYRPGDQPHLTGVATYSSGAPVEGGAVAISWEVQGGWPPPTEWLSEGLLPQHATTSPAGRFQLDLPAVPADLDGQATLVAHVAVTDVAGDRVEGGAAVLLSKDGITASAVTELADGLVAGFNNRVYLRVATADGRPLGGAKVNVRRAWAPRDPGIDAELDEDGVASLQLDPGPAVNVVVPAPPARPPPKRKLVIRGAVRDLLGHGGASLEDQVAMDGWLPELAPCAKWVANESEALQLALRVDENGAISTLAASGTPLGACFTERLKSKRLPGGAARLYAAAFTVNEPDLPRLDGALDNALDLPGGVGDKLARGLRGARDCLPLSVGDGAWPRALVVHTRAGKKDVELNWVKDPDGTASANARVETACVEGRLRGLALDEPAAADGLGVERLHVTLPPRLTVARAQPTILQGYELVVTAAVDGAPSTKLRMTPGTVPPLRLRTTPVLAKPGDKIAVEVIRGPSFVGTLPEVVTLDHIAGHVEAKLDAKTHQAELVLDSKAEGWCEIRAGGARGLVFVRPKNELAVAIAPAKEQYAPGQTAELAVHTRVAGQGAPAAVGLFGVDESLGQLAPLVGPDDFGRVRPTVGMSGPAFGLLDGQALALGRIRGANAAAATVLRVTTLPTAPDLDAVANGGAATPFDPTVELTDRFYTVLGELHAQTRRWETEAPAAEKMQPETMAKLWQRALDACGGRGERIDDAFGRPLRLSRLPADLLALTDPRAVVLAGTRLPEDVESWTAWVGREQP
jgi:hypothetical protein